MISTKFHENRLIIEGEIDEKHALLVGTWSFYILNIINQSFPITLNQPDMSGKTEVGLAKYPATSDLQSGYFFGQFCFWSFFGLTR